MPADLRSRLIHDGEVAVRARLGEGLEDIGSWQHLLVDRADGILESSLKGFLCRRREHILFIGSDGTQRNSRVGGVRHGSPHSDWTRMPKGKRLCLLGASRRWAAVPLCAITAKYNCASELVASST